MTDDEDGVFLWTARRGEDGNPIPVWKMSLKEARERTRIGNARMEERFRKAPFPLYGLPPTRQGDRFIGGGWSGRPEGRERTKSLGLVHGTLVHGSEPMLVVETGIEFSIGGGDLLSIAGLVWEGRAANIEEAVAQYARHVGGPTLDPIPERIDLTFDVDGVPTSFDGFVREEEWVARARVGPVFFTVEGKPFDAADVALVRVTDIEPYIVGSRRFHERDR